MRTRDDYKETAFISTRNFAIVFFILLLTCYRRPIVAGFDNRLLHESSRLAKVSPIKKKKIYLTFDDGPNRGTRNLLDIIKAEQVPVTFFIVGKRVFTSQKQEQLWDSLKMIHQIKLCNHSFYHAKGHYIKYYQSPDSVVKDFEQTNAELKFDNSIARTPGRNIWRIDSLNITDVKKSSAAADSLQHAGFILMGWDLEWRFDRKKMSVTASAQEMIQKIDDAFKKNKTRCKNNLVILAHDQAYVNAYDSTQLRLFLQLLKQRNDYEISLVSDYPGVGKQSYHSN